VFDGVAGRNSTNCRAEFPIGAVRLVTNDKTAFPGQTRPRFLALRHNGSTKGSGCDAPPRMCKILGPASSSSCFCFYCFSRSPPRMSCDDAAAMEPENITMHHSVSIHSLPLFDSALNSPMHLMVYTASGGFLVSSALLRASSARETRTMMLAAPIYRLPPMLWGSHRRPYRPYITFVPVTGRCPPARPLPPCPRYPRSTTR